MHPSRFDLLLVARYGAIGIFGASVQVATLWFWVAILGLPGHYLWGVVAGFLIALGVTFPLQKYWTFRDTSKDQTERQFGSYTAIALLSLVGNTVLLSLAKHLLEYANVDFFRVWYLVCEAGIVISIAGFSFISNYFLTFNRLPRNDA